MANYEWILTEKVTGEERLEDGVPTGDFLVRGENGREAWLSLSADGGELRFDGEFVDVGDDLIEYISTMDEIQETGASEPYADV
jgi:hypothetical protein